MYAQINYGINNIKNRYMYVFIHHSLYFCNYLPFKPTINLLHINLKVKKKNVIANIMKKKNWVTVNALKYTLVQHHLLGRHNP